VVGEHPHHLLHLEGGLVALLRLLLQVGVHQVRQLHLEHLVYHHHREVILP
jgi:hypothetical protein